MNEKWLHHSTLKSNPQRDCDVEGVQPFNEREMDPPFYS